MLYIYYLNQEWGLLSVLIVAVAALFLHYLLRLRHFKLVPKYASWQTEAQVIEQATHEALIAGHDMSKVFVSIIVPVNSHNVGLAETLVKLLFAQDTDVQFEVILAEEGLSDEVKDVYKRNKDTYAQLRYTFVPDSSRYIEHRKLAITLGIKASRGEWSIIVNPETHPIDNNWLHHYVQNLTSDLNFVEAYYNYEDDGSHTVRRAIFDGVVQWVKRLEAYEDGCIYGCNTSNWAVRNSWFIAQNGFADSLNIALGEESIFANRHAVSEQTLFLCSPSTKLQEVPCSPRELLSQRIYKSEATQHFQKNAQKYKYKEALATLLLYIYCMAMFTYLIDRIATDVSSFTYHTQCWYTDVIALLLLIINIGLPWYIIRRALSIMQERKFGVYIYFYYLWLPFCALSTEWQRWLHKQEFTRKYI